MKRILKPFFLSFLTIVVTSLLLAGNRKIQSIRSATEYLHEHAPYNTKIKPISKIRKNKSTANQKNKKRKNSKKPTPEEIYENADYLVKIKTFAATRIPLINQVFYEYSGFGSGSIVKCAQYEYCILTAYHVVDSSSAIFYAEFKDGSPPQKLELIYGSTNYDSAILRFTDNRVKPNATANIDRSSALKTGTAISTMGSSLLGDFWFNANGHLYAEVGPADPVLQSILEGGGLNHPKLMFISAKIFPGYSGGPILNKNGKLVGISIGYVKIEEASVYLGSPIDEIKTEMKIIK